MLHYLLIAVIVLVVLAVVFALLWPKIRAKVPANLQPAGDKAALAIDQAEAVAGLTAALYDFADHGTPDDVDVIKTLRTKVSTWTVPSVDPAPAAAVTVPIRGATP